VNHWQIQQQSYRTCYKQIRWPHSSNILDVTFHWISSAFVWVQKFNKKLIKERNLLENFVKERCFEKKCFDNEKCNKFSSVKDKPMVRNMIKTICCLARQRTWNFGNVFSNLFTEWCLLFNQLTCVRIEQNHLSASPSACDSHKVYLRTISCCNKCQVNLFYFQRFDIMFILSSSPKVWIWFSRLSQIWLSLPNTAVQSSILLHANTLANPPNNIFTCWILFWITTANH